MDLSSSSSSSLPLGGSLSLDADIEEDTVELVSKEGEPHAVNRRTALMSKHIDNVLSNDRRAKSIELSNVSSAILKIILEYMTYHTTGGRDPSMIKEIAKPVRSLEMRKIVDDVWDADFADRMTPKQIFEIILAANYMQVDPLLHLFSAKTATMIKSKSHDEIRKMFSSESSQPVASSK